MTCFDFQSGRKFGKVLASLHCLTLFLDFAVVVKYLHPQIICQKKTCDGDVKNDARSVEQKLWNSRALKKKVIMQHTLYYFET